MVAYGFKKFFAPQIEDGSKGHTIRLTNFASITRTSMLSEQLRRSDCDYALPDRDPFDRDDASRGCRSGLDQILAPDTSSGFDATHQGLLQGGGAQRPCRSSGYSVYQTVYRQPLPTFHQAPDLPAALPAQANLSAEDRSTLSANHVRGGF